MILMPNSAFKEISKRYFGEKHFRTQYQALHQEDLDRYLTQHAPQFREDFLKHFPGETQVERQVWTIEQTWS